VSDLASVLGSDGLRPAVHTPEEVASSTEWMVARDGARLATELYLPPAARTGRVPALALRTPYGRTAMADVALELARRGFAVIAQDVRGTGDSDADAWDFTIYESDDGIDFVDWVGRQPWYDGFLGGLGGSYLGGTQWCLARHPQMTAIAPEVGDLGSQRSNGVRPHMFVNAYSTSVGHGADKVGVDFSEREREMREETSRGGYFNDPLHGDLPTGLTTRYPYLRTLAPMTARRWLWRQLCALDSAGRAELLRVALGKAPDGDVGVSYADTFALNGVFPPEMSGEAYLLPRLDAEELYREVHAPPLIVTGWYDWGLGPSLESWGLLQAHGRPRVRENSRLVITPAAHNMPGYLEGVEEHPELDRHYRTSSIVDVLVHWYDAVRADSVATIPRVTYYLMGANQWRTAETWPPPEGRAMTLHLGAGGTLSADPPPASSPPDSYVYDPVDATPTAGGSIVSDVFRPGSTDVSEVQGRPDVLVYTTEVLSADLDVVGPIRMTLFASSSACDTDFVVRLSDVFPDGRAVQLQTGMVRARYRDLERGPSLIDPGVVHEYDIDLWATANRFRTGHALRIDISSADFPRFERNANLGGAAGVPRPAQQVIHHDAARPSSLRLMVLDV
jgi:predicted acyl esterase